VRRVKVSLLGLGSGRSMRHSSLSFFRFYRPSSVCKKLHSPQGFGSHIIALWKAEGALPWAALCGRRNERAAHRYERAYSASR
jgi:hypothetical protein